MTRISIRSLRRTAAIAAAGLSALAAAPALATEYAVTNLVASSAAVAGNSPTTTIDPNLVNPWGISASATSPFWVSDEKTGVATLYNTTGAKVNLTVAIPGGAPTGQVFNSTTGFDVQGGGNGAKASFIFDSLNGSISAWNTVGGPAFTQVTTPGAVYTGLALGGNNLYAANIATGNVDVYNNSFQLTSSFTDTLAAAAGYKAFNVQQIGGVLYVTFEKTGGAAPFYGFGAGGTGYVDEFALDGTLLKQLITPATPGAPTAPWGVDIAPADFGQYSNDLLIGNFGTGEIGAYDPNSGAFLGDLIGTDGQPIVEKALWSLTNGNGGMGGLTDTVYFDAGLAGQAGGVLGSLTAVPEPSTWALMILGVGAIGFAARRRQAASVAA